MLALETTSYRLFPLPNIYNFRRFTLTSLYNIKGPARPVIVHTSVFKQLHEEFMNGTIDDEAKNMLLDNYANTAYHSALQSVAECANRIQAGVIITRL